jgi:iron(II)-dependent oxidoreductase
MRERSAALFALLTDAAYYSQPIDLRHPIVFYDGHLPAFSFSTLVRNALREESIDPRLETLFARGIDPDERGDARAATAWPDRDAVRQFAAEADRRVAAALGGISLDQGEVAQTVRMLLEHEAMHQETLLYMWQRLPHEQKTRPTYLPYEVKAPVPPRDVVRIPAGRATLGARRDAITFGWDNEFDAHTVDVDAFELDLHSATNADYLPFVEAGLA